MDTKLMLTVLLIVICILIVLLIILIIKDNNDKKNMNRELINLQNNIRSDLNVLNQNNNTQFLQMNDSIHQQFFTSLQSTDKIFDEVMQKMVTINESQKQIQDLSNDIKGLHQVLNDKKTRGIFGEIELYTVLENSYGEDTSFYAKQYTLHNGKMVDAVIFLKDMIIPIDSKFPLENYVRLQEESKDSKTLFNAFQQDVKKHINDIYKKYINSDETCEFAYMFIPAEAIYSYIYANCMDVVEEAYAKKVYIVSPTTLMAYLSAIKVFYLNQKKNDKMKDMQVELNKLKLEFDRFRTRYEQVGKDFDKISKDMNDVLITANKIDKQFVKIENVEFEENN